ncbi:MAG: ECF-type sigma factor [Chthoniobacteraceae bacterium]
MADVTILLDAIQSGDSQAAEQLLPLVYAELRRLAAVKMNLERPGQTLQATALVHEAWLRLGAGARFENRAHFFSAAAEAMRRILIERARRKMAARNGAGQENIDIETLEIAAPSPDEEMLAVDEALELFAVEDAQTAELVKLSYFAGFSLAEAAELLGLTERTAKRRWTYARAWLFDALKRRAR